MAHSSASGAAASFACRTVSSSASSSLLDQAHSRKGSNAPPNGSRAGSSSSRLRTVPGESLVLRARAEGNVPSSNWVHSGDAKTSHALGEPASAASRNDLVTSSKLASCCESCSCSEAATGVAGPESLIRRGGLPTGAPHSMVYVMPPIPKTRSSWKAFAFGDAVGNAGLGSGRFTVGSGEEGVESWRPTGGGW